MRIPIVLSLLVGFCLQASASAPTRGLNPRQSPDGQSLVHNVVAYGEKASLNSRTRSFTLSLLNDLGFYCTGILIHPRVVLTNGHCLIDKEDVGSDGLVRKASEIRVRFGLNGNDPEGYEVTTSEFFINPEYLSTLSVDEGDSSSNPRANRNVEVDWNEFDRSRNKALNQGQLNFYEFGNSGENDLRSHDYALIFLDQPARKPFQPVLIDTDTPLNLHSEYYVAGFGEPTLDFGSETRTAHFKNPDLRFAKYFFIGLHYKYIGNHLIPLGLESFPLRDEFFCGGDSGGPLVVEVGEELRLLALNKAYIESCAGPMYSIFVPSLVEWIENQMNVHGIKGGLPKAEAI